MWFRTEQIRKATKNEYTIEYSIVDDTGTSRKIVQPAYGQQTARTHAETLSKLYNQDITVYGEDKEGRFTLGVATQVDRASDAEEEVLRELYAKSVDQSLTLRDQLLQEFDPGAIKAMAQLGAGLSSIAKAYTEAGKREDPSVNYNTLYSMLLHVQESPEIVGLPGNMTDIALLSQQLEKGPLKIEITGDATIAGEIELQILPELRYLGDAERRILTSKRPDPITYHLDGQQKVIRVRPFFKGKVTMSDGAAGQFLIILQSDHRYSNHPTSAVIVGAPEIIQNAVYGVWKLLVSMSLTKNRLAIISSGSYKVYSQPPMHKDWADLVPNEKLKEELDLIVNSLIKRDELIAKGNTLKRGTMISGFPGVGKSASLAAMIHAIMGKATIFLVESVQDIREVYNWAATYSPSVVIFEDLDLITVNRRDYSATKDSATGELLAVLSGTAEYPDIITIATTNHPEKIDDALIKRPGRFDVHLRVEPPNPAERMAILELYLNKYEVPEIVGQHIKRMFEQQLSKQILVGAHIEEFVKVGAKRMLLKSGPPSVTDFEPGIEAIKSVSSAKQQ